MQEFILVSVRLPEGSRELFMSSVNVSFTAERFNTLCYCTANPYSTGISNLTSTTANLICPVDRFMRLIKSDILDPR